MKLQEVRGYRGRDQGRIRNTPNKLGETDGATPGPPVGVFRSKPGPLQNDLVRGPQGFRHGGLASMGVTEGRGVVSGDCSHSFWSTF